MNKTKIDWRIGQWKEFGIALFRKQVFRGWNIVDRLLYPTFTKGVSFLEENGVTDGLFALEFDRELFPERSIHQ